MDTSDASYEQAQSRLRLSMTCRENVRPIPYPLEARIVDLAFFKNSNKNILIKLNGGT